MSTHYLAIERARFGSATMPAERRDADAAPHVLLTHLDETHGVAYLHAAGDSHVRTAPVCDAVDDPDLIAGMTPEDALRLGIEYGRRIVPPQIEIVNGGANE